MLSLFDPRSRMRRWAYALYHLAVPVFFLHASAFAYLALKRMEESGGTGVWSSAYLGLGALLLAVSVLFSVRRLHDMGKSGWWALLSFVPVVNFFLVLVLMLAPGTPGPNRYGPDRRQTLGGSPATA